MLSVRLGVVDLSCEIVSYFSEEWFIQQWYCVLHTTNLCRSWQLLMATKICRTATGKVMPIDDIK